jgi:methionyl-tRNA formyltransferase
VHGELVPVPQPAEGVTLAPMIKKEEGRLDFRRTAPELERRVRAFTPWPGAFVEMREAERLTLLKVHRARAGVSSRPGAPGTLVSASAEGLEVACADGSLWLQEIQPEGRRRMSATEFLAGHPLTAGTAPFAL